RLQLRRAVDTDILRSGIRVLFAFSIFRDGSVFFGLAHDAYFPDWVPTKMGAKYVRASSKSQIRLIWKTSSDPQDLFRNIVQITRCAISFFRLGGLRLDDRSRLRTRSVLQVENDPRGCGKLENLHRNRIPKMKSEDKSLFLDLRKQFDLP